MKSASMVGIVLLAAAIVYGEWKNTPQRQERWVVAGIMAGAVILSIVLLLLPGIPGPSQFVKLVFGQVDQYMK
ncbi:hypothetical protein [Paenibacillus hubeiensis]|uniref:hypothetical protein n=1 Tax=Paenibacillus hubeiensis TaxID=3077330 RepID=UPI0031B9EBFA